MSAYGIDLENFDFSVYGGGAGILIISAMNSSDLYDFKALLK